MTKLKKTMLKIKIVSLLVFSILLGCSSSGDDDSDKLKVEISSGVNNIIPSSTRSCDEEAKGTLVAGSISNYFEVPSPVIAWQGNATSEVRVEVLRLTVDSPQIGKYECTLSSSSLNILFWKREYDKDKNVLVSSWDHHLGANSADTITSTSELKAKGYTSCPIKCGGVSIKKDSLKFTAKGKWELIAIEKRFSADNSSYEEIPLKVTGEFKVQNPF